MRLSVSGGDRRHRAQGGGVARRRGARRQGGRLMIRVKRTYDAAARGDGRRVLVERLWPRGMKKEALALDAWMKDVAPSTALRQWFGHRVERWDEFRRRYLRELDDEREAWEPLLAAARSGPVTLLYSARDELHNSAVVLGDYLVAREGARPAATKASAGRRGGRLTGTGVRRPRGRPGSRRRRR
jgi:uncharacterized protein YeaO (DUF488 family)